MTNPEKREPEHKGSIWTHPYMLYILITIALFLFLLIMGWVGLEQGWIPDRRVNG